MKKFALALATVVVTAVLTSCNTTGPDNQNPKLVLETNLGGRIFRFGSSVNLEWSCSGCDYIEGTSVVARLRNAANDGYRPNVVVFGPKTGKATWYVGQTSDGQSDMFLSPGFYYLRFESYPPSNRESSSYPANVYVDSEVFQIAR